MAISEDVPGIAVTVRCHGHPLPEFGDPDAQDHIDAATYPLETNYVQCIDNSAFDICIAIGPAYQWGYRDHIVVARVRIDGESVKGYIFQQHIPFHHMAICQGKEICNNFGVWCLRKFKFVAVKTVDDAQKERVERDVKAATGLGTIEVKFSRAIQRGTVTTHRADTDSRNLELAEKSLKGRSISHGTSYGSREAISAPTFVHVDDLPEDNGPIVVFKFLYRSREALKRELIIPRSPSRSPTLEDLTPAERDRLARERLNELREKKIKSDHRPPLIKREFNDVFDLTVDPPASRPTKKSRLQDDDEVEVIDLTDD